MIDFLALGELLINFTPIKTNSTKPCCEQNPGGAPPNILTMESQLGVAFIGKVIILGIILKSLLIMV